MTFIMSVSNLHSLLPPHSVMLEGSYEAQPAFKGREIGLHLLKIKVSKNL